MELLISRSVASFCAALDVLRNLVEQRLMIQTAMLRFRGVAPIDVPKGCHQTKPSTLLGGLGVLSQFDSNRIVPHYEEPEEVHTGGSNLFLAEMLLAQHDADIGSVVAGMFSEAEHAQSRLRAYIAQQLEAPPSLLPCSGALASSSSLPVPSERPPPEYLYDAALRDTLQSSLEAVATLQRVVHCLKRDCASICYFEQLWDCLDIAEGERIGDSSPSLSFSDALVAVRQALERRWVVTEYSS